jgi:hypothetical protein
VLFQASSRGRLRHIASSTTPPAQAIRTTVAGS